MSTTSYAPPDVARAVAPRPPLYNLFSVAEPFPDGVRWQAGVRVFGYAEDTPFGFSACDEGTDNLKDEGGFPPTPWFEAFEAYVPINCSRLGIGSWEEYKSLANEALLAGAAHAAERQLSQGAFLAYTALEERNPNLAEVATVIGGGAVDPREGLALLENAGAETARAYVLHATPGIATAWAFEGGLVSDGRVMRTHLGTPVVVGGGYIGADAGTNPDANTEYAFVTGPIMAAVSELHELAPDEASTLDRATNDPVYRAEVEILVAWDRQLQAAALIDWS